MGRKTLALLFAACAILSSFLTYLVVSGYWYETGITIPGLPTLAITEVRFPLDNTSYFELTVMNPSYSFKAVRLENVCVVTPDGHFHVIEDVRPSLPMSLGAGESVNFTCMWDWANYTGAELMVLVLIRNGSGASYYARPPAVKLILKAFFNASSPFWFLLNVTNSPGSPTAVNITAVDAILDNGTVLENLPTKPKISPKKPYVLKPDSTLTLNCTLNWLAYRDRNMTIRVRSVQGYRGYLGLRTPPPVVIRIVEVNFVKDAGACYFNITVMNEFSSPAPARIYNISAVVDGLYLGPEDLKVTPSLKPPVIIRPGENLTFMCNWNWSPYEGYTMNITVVSILGYIANASVQIKQGVQKTALSPEVRPSPRSCSSPSSRGPLLCAPRARTRTSALCALCPSRRSSRPVSRPRRPLL